MSIWFAVRSLRVGVFVCLLSPAFTAASELTIFEMRKTLPLSDSEAALRDFYIRGGSEAGLKVGQVLLVQRRIPLYDTFANRSAGDLEVGVARLRIVHVQKGLAVGRVHSDLARENAPLLEDNFIMVGDVVDARSAQASASPSSGDGSGATVALGEPSPRDEIVLVDEPASFSGVKSLARITVNSVDLDVDQP
jgi:hypothetical protein